MAREYWQSLDEYHELPAVAEEAHREFPENHVDDSLGLSANRRDFLKLLGLGFTAGAIACTPAPVKKAMPYLNKPEELTPGLASWYASTCGGCSVGCGVLAKVRDGRPIKLEGNPEHPLNGGGLCAVGQASVLSLYDATRLRGPRKGDASATWQVIDAEISAKLSELKGKGLPVAIVSSSTSSPSLLALLKQFSEVYPQTRHVVYDAVSLAALRAAHKEAFGKALVPGYRFDRAAVIVSLGADFLGTWISPVEFTAQYAKTRKLSTDKVDLSYHVQFESGLSLTGSNADRRVPVNASEQGIVALYLLENLMIKANPAMRFLLRVSNPPVDAVLLDGVVDALWQGRGKSLVVSGSNDLSLQLVVARINEVLGNYGRTLDLAHPSLQYQSDDAAMAQLVTDMEAGKIGGLILLDANPVYSHPEGKRFGEAMKKLPLSVSLAGTLDETAAFAQYVAPQHYYLEAWGDAEPRSGLYGLQQPTINPLFDTRAREESLLAWMGRPQGAYDYIQAHWKAHIFPLQKAGVGFQSFWDKSVRDGFFASDRAESAGGATLSGARVDKAASDLIARHEAGLASRKSGQFEVSLYQKVSLRDGKVAGNPWLQELPDPITKVSWANYVSMAPQAAKHLGLEQGDVVAIGTKGASLELPVYVQPGQVMGTLSIALGYGRSCGNKVYGQNAYPLVTASAPFAQFETTGVTVKPTGKTAKLALMQTHSSAEGRPIALETTLEAFKKDPYFAREATGAHHELVSLWDKHEKKGHSWGMVIDLNSCTGCSACTVACQAENNIPTVGEDEIRRNRDMYWIRIDRYHKNTPENPDTIHEPMLCQHCENAPCETVCPVLATLHSSEGLNQQAYNRCVGTRYCANNCPYKVRRFNWFDYPHDDLLANMVLNPDVTVRSRGVMEKCSMCAQRIQAGKAEVKKAGRAYRDGDVRMACEQSCPAQAIVFGDTNDPESRVSKLKKDPRNYRILEDLGTRPVVSYLAKVRNRSI